MPTAAKSCEAEKPPDAGYPMNIPRESGGRKKENYHGQNAQKEESCFPYRGVRRALFRGAAGQCGVPHDGRRTGDPPYRDAPFRQGDRLTRPDGSAHDKVAQDAYDAGKRPQPEQGLAETDGKPHGQIIQDA